MAEKLWSFQEIKFMRIHSSTSPEELAKLLNEKFHGGQSVRTGADTSRVRRQKNIF